MPPSLDDLATAEAPPPVLWRTEIHGHTIARPPPAELTRAAEALMHDVGWRAAQPMQPARNLLAVARREAEDRLSATRAQATAPHIACVPVPESMAAHQRGMTLARQYGPLLTALAGVLDGLDDVIPHSALAAMPDEDVRALAAERAAHALSAWQWRMTMAQSRGTTLPTTPDDLRRQCPLWQRRQLRRAAGLTRQHLAIALGTVGKGGAPYADNYSLARWRERQTAKQEWAKQRVLRTSRGTEVPMAEVMAAGQQAALARLGAVLHGMEDAATDAGLRAIFVTMTLPPRYHGNPKHGARPNRAISPQATDAAMRSMWMRFRARCAKRGITMLGIRVWEPHQDTCPHVHALLYVTADQADEVDRVLVSLCPEPPHPQKLYGPPERVASTIERINRERGRATTYVTKYIRKALSSGDGDGIGRDQYQRHLATASERGWRRYALLGVHGVQRTWQRLATAGDREMRGAPEAVADVRAALGDGRWSDALTGLGAIRERGVQPRIRLTYEERTTVYGDTAKRAVSVTDTGTGWSLPLSRGAEVAKRLREQDPAKNAKEKAEIRTAWTDIRARLGWHAEAAETKKANENSEVTFAVTCPRATPAAQPEESADLFLSDDGVLFDPQTGEIVDEIADWTAPPSRQTAEKERFVDAYEMLEAA